MQAQILPLPTTHTDDVIKCRCRDCANLKAKLKETGAVFGSLDDVMKLLLDGELK